MKRIILSLIVAISLQFLACSDPYPYDVDSKPAGRLSVPFTMLVCSEALNDDNPLEFVGLYHNYGLQYFAAYCEVNGWPAEADLQQLTTQLTHEFLSEMLIVVTENGDTLDTDQYIRSIDSCTSYQEAFFSITPPDTTWTYFCTYPAEVQEYLLSLYDIFSDTTCTDVFGEIRQLEADIIQNSDTSFTKTRAVLLATSAVARHSYAYMTDTLSRPYWPSEIYPDGSKIYLTKGKDPKGSSSTPADKKNLASDVATSDACGGAAGAIVGGIKGAVGAGLLGFATGGAGLALIAEGFIVGSGAGALHGALEVSIVDLMAGGALGRNIKEHMKVEKKK